MIKRFVHRSFSQVRQFKQYYDLRKSQWLARPILEKIQEKKLRNIIRHAYRNVPYYHRLLKSSNLNPDSITTVDDLSKIPLLTKSAIQSNPTKIIANNVYRNRCFLDRTSGSTGRPLTILIDQNTHENIGSRYLRFYFESGVKLRDRIARFSAPRQFFQDRSWFNSIGFLRRENFSVFGYIEDHVTNLLEYSPDVIEGYSSMIQLVAETVQDKNVEGIDPRLIFCTAELLTRHTREQIDSAFNTELFDHYGSAEFGTFAWECQEHNGYHIDIESVVVEFLRNGETVSPGEKGEIVVTGLFNYAMPLIRYSLDDIGAPTIDQCSCGRGLPLVKLVDGRADDFLVLPSGRIISPRTINLLDYIDGIAEYRIIQKEKDKFMVQVVTGRNFSKKTIVQVKEEILKGCLGEDVEISIRLVDEIPRDKSGKIRTVVSEVKKPAL